MGLVVQHSQWNINKNKMGKVVQYSQWNINKKKWVCLLIFH
jgi:hypothetical protein